MTDDLFSQLAELFNQPGPINWRLATEIARHLAGEKEPVDPWLAEEYLDLGRLSVLHISAHGLNLDPGLKVVPVDRTTWVEAHLQSFSYLGEPLGEKFTPEETVLKPLGPALAGMQMGTMVGYLSHRVLGQFDVGLPVAEEGDVLLVAANLEQFAEEHSLDPRQARLWASLHEVVYHAILRIEWVRPAIIRAIEEYVEGLSFDPSRLVMGMESLTDPEAMEGVLGDPSALAAMFGADEQKPQLERVQALTALIEGFGDFVVQSSAHDLLPELDRLEAALEARRAEPAAGEGMLAQMLGLEITSDLHRRGATFCEEIDRRWGVGALRGVWEAEDQTPSLAEIDDPVGWAARVLLE